MLNKLITRSALSIWLGVHTTQTATPVEDLSGLHAVSQLVVYRGFDTPFYLNDDHSPKFQSNWSLSNN